VICQNNFDSDAEPISRKDYNGETPYEVREVDDESDLGEQNSIQYQSLQEQPLEKVVDETKTVPRMLADGRLVRLPIENVQPQQQQQQQPQIQIQAEQPQVQVQAEEPKQQEVELPEMHSTRPLAPFTRPKAPKSVDPGSDVAIEMISLKEGSQQPTTTTTSSTSSSSTSQGQAPSFSTKKVRVSSLISGILSSTLSSVLTRGMQFASDRGY